MLRTQIQNNTEQEVERYYLTWVCEGGDERMRPRGKPLRPGCGYTNPRVTKKNPDDITGVCLICSRKRRLNGGIVRFHPTKRQMKLYCERANWELGWKSKEESE